MSPPRSVLFEVCWAATGLELLHLNAISPDDPLGRHFDTLVVGFVFTLVSMLFLVTAVVLYVAESVTVLTVTTQVSRFRKHANFKVRVVNVLAVNVWFIVPLISLV